MIKLFQAAGHKVYLVTMRYECEGKEVKEQLEGVVDGIYFTGCKAKDKFMFSKGISIDVFIDDVPFFCIHDASS